MKKPRTSTTAPRAQKEKTKPTPPTKKELIAEGRRIIGKCGSLTLELWNEHAKYPSRQIAACGYRWFKDFLAEL